MQHGSSKRASWGSEQLVCQHGVPLDAPVRPKGQTPVDVVMGRSETERPLNSTISVLALVLSRWASWTRGGIQFLSPVCINTKACFLNKCWHSQKSSREIMRKGICVKNYFLKAMWNQTWPKLNIPGHIMHDSSVHVICLFSSKCNSSTIKRLLSLQVGGENNINHSFLSLTSTDRSSKILILKHSKLLF